MPPLQRHPHDFDGIGQAAHNYGMLDVFRCDQATPGERNPASQCNPTSTNVAIVPPSLANVGEYGENIYDAAKAGNWTTAADKLRGLKDAAHQVRLDVRNANTDRLDAQLGSVDKAPWSIKTAWSPCARRIK